MHRSDNSRYFLFIEPSATEKLHEPVEDRLVKIVEYALSKAKRGSSYYSNLSCRGEFHEGAAYRGFHDTECGEMSDSCDFLLENGLITNSLAPFYLRWYRNSIPRSEEMKLRELAIFYREVM